MRTVAARADELMRVIYAALEAAEVGDLPAVEAILHGALEDGSSKRPHRCRFCPADFEWPGLLTQHVVLQHTVDQPA